MEEWICFRGHVDLFSWTHGFLGLEYTAFCYGYEKAVQAIKERL